MKIKQIVINNIGPFSLPTKINFESGVTILTGSNDSGKTSILKTMGTVLAARAVNEEDVNNYSRNGSNKIWSEDPEIYAQINFYDSEKLTKEIVTNAGTSILMRGDEVLVTFKLAPKIISRDIEIKREQKPISGNFVIKKLPTVINLPKTDQIRRVLTLSSLNQTEAKFLDQAFGENSVRRLKSIVSNLSPELRRAGERISTTLETFLGKDSGFEFVFDKDGKGENLKLELSLRDKFNNEAFLALRGNGLQKLINMFVEIISIQDYTNDVMVLLDEPENSLHADAQHKLRRLLERFGEKDNIQIIYATHSPAMINPLKPNCVRLLRKTTINERPTIEVVNTSKDDNYSLVRSNLGISFADSLMIGEVTIIAEGITEVKCLPQLFQRAKKAKLIDFDDGLFSDIFFLNGQGETLKKWYKLVKQQNSYPIIFIDGDKKIFGQAEAIREENVNTPIISLQRGTEFEDLIAREKYFEALENQIKGDFSVEKLNNQFTSFEENGDENYRQKMFSKRVECFLQDKFQEFTFYKHQVMFEAINLCADDDIKFEKIIELINSIKDHLR